MYNNEISICNKYSRSTCVTLRAIAMDVKTAAWIPTENEDLSKLSLRPSQSAPYLFISEACTMTMTAKPQLRKFV